LRWTVDVQEDLDLVRRLYETLDLDQPVPYLDVVDHVRRHPDLMQINEGIETWTPEGPGR
jgi:spore coat polysaccharide biosynthesis protein SpsF (cytidylyltransferase family)